MKHLAGRVLILDPALLLVLPIINVPPGTTRIRIRQRGAWVPRLYVKTASSLRTYFAACVDDNTAIELIPCSDGNYVRKLEEVPNE